MKRWVWQVGLVGLVRQVGQVGQVGLVGLVGKADGLLNPIETYSLLLTTFTSLLAYLLILNHLQQVGNLLQTFHQRFLNHSFNKGVQFGFDG